MLNWHYSDEDIEAIRVQTIKWTVRLRKILNRTAPLPRFFDDLYEDCGDYYILESLDDWDGFSHVKAMTSALAREVFQKLALCATDDIAINDNHESDAEGLKSLTTLSCFIQSLRFYGYETAAAKLSVQAIISYLPVSPQKSAGSFPKLQHLLDEVKQCHNTIGGHLWGKEMDDDEDDDKDSSYDEADVDDEDGADDEDDPDNDDGPDDDHDDHHHHHHHHDDDIDNHFYYLDHDDANNLYRWRHTTVLSVFLQAVVDDDDSWKIWCDAQKKCSTDSVDCTFMNSATVSLPLPAYILLKCIKSISRGPWLHSVVNVREVVQYFFNVLLICFVIYRWTFLLNSTSCCLVQQTVSSLLVLIKFENFS